MCLSLRRWLGSASWYRYLLLLFFTSTHAAGKSGTSPARVTRPLFGLVCPLILGLLALAWLATYRHGRPSLEVCLSCWWLGVPVHLLCLTETQTTSAHALHGSREVLEWEHEETCYSLLDHLPFLEGLLLMGITCSTLVHPSSLYSGFHRTHPHGHPVNSTVFHCLPAWPWPGRGPTRELVKAPI